MVEDKLLVVGSSTPSIAIGERIETIDGEPVEQVIKKKSEEISAPSKQWCMWRLYGHSQLLAGISNSSVTLGLGNNRSVELKRTMSVYIGRERNEPHPPHLSELHPGVFYVDLCLITPEELNPTSPFMSLISERGRAFVCDIRGYPTGAALEFVRHLSSNDIIGVPCSTFTATRPDRVEFVEDAHTQFTMPPLQPKLDLHAVFMTSGRAISYAETLLAIIEHFKLGPIVGEPSAGTNGNLSKVQLPGGYTFSYTGLRVRKLDGSEQHCTGLQPTVHVSRTVRGVMEKRDEMLETALALVLKEIGN